MVFSIFLNAGWHESLAGALATSIASVALLTRANGEATTDADGRSKTSAQELQSIDRSAQATAAMQGDGPIPVGIEEELRQSRMRTEFVLNSVTDLHLLIDRSWRILYANE